MSAPETNHQHHDYLPSERKLSFRSAFVTAGTSAMVLVGAGVGLSLAVADGLRDVVLDNQGRSENLNN